MSHRLRRQASVWFALFIGLATALLAAATDSRAGRQQATRDQPELVLQTGHAKGVDSIAFSIDRRLLASGSADSTIKIWDVTLGRELRTLGGHSGGVEAVAFSPDGEILASGALEGQIKLWNVASGRELVSIAAHSSRINTVVFSPDGKLLASGASDNTVKLWEVPTGRAVTTLSGHAGWVLALAFSPDGQTLASGSSDNTVRLWDVSDGRQRRLLRARGAVRALDFSPDGQALATGAADSTLVIWRLNEGQKPTRPVPGPGPVLSVAFVRDTKAIAVAYVNRTVKQYDTVTLRELQSREDTAGTGIYEAIAFSRDGAWQASSNGGRTIELRSLTDRSERRTLAFNSNSVRASAFSPDGRWFATGNQDNTIKVWDLVEGRQVRTMNGDASINALAFSPDSQWLASGSLSGKIMIWEIAFGREAPLTLAHSLGVNALVFSADGKWLLSGGVDKEIAIWETANGHRLRTLKHSDEVRALSLSSDGRLLASGGADKSLKLWDLATGAERFKLEGHAGGVYATAFSRDGRWLASGSADKTVKVWDTETGREVKTLAGHTGWVNAVEFSPDGRWLVSGGDDKSVRIWKAATGELAQTLTGHSGSINSLSFDSKGRLLATGSEDGSTRMWEAETWDHLATLVSLRESTEWVVVTPNGLFDGSPSAWSQILWRFSGITTNAKPVEVFFNEFYYPDLLADALKGKRPHPAIDITKRDRRQPLVTLAPEGTPGASREMTVKLNVAEAPSDEEHQRGSGARDVRLFRNGSLVKVWPGDVLKGRGSQVRLEYSLPIRAGENRLTAYAFNEDNVKSLDATLVVNGVESLRRKGTLYILAVGINQYENREYSLKWAQQDAQELSTELQRQQARLGRFARIEVVTLLNQEATKANILMALRRLVRGADGTLPAGAPPVLEKLVPAQPEDDVVIFFAGHGTARDSRFYLIPHDLGYLGKRNEPSVEDLDNIFGHSISDLELELALRDLDAGRILLVIDACNSGQALEADEKRLGPMNSKGLAQLAYEKGINILAAAQSYQAAIEASRLGHGYLTYALVIDGLRNMSADNKPRDGQVLLREWLDYAIDRVPQIQASKETARRDIRLSRDRLDEVQRPRAFYRREAEAEPWIIAGSATPAAPSGSARHDQQ